MQVKYMISTA